VYIESVHLEPGDDDDDASARGEEKKSGDGLKGAVKNTLFKIFFGAK
jgi:hypothetical protein